MKILGTGLNGLVGSRITELLKDKYEFENISRSNGVDITSADDVLQAVSKSEAPWVIHMAAKANVDGCEEDKHLGERGEAWQINVVGSKNVASACEQTNKKLIYISTDFVYDGEKSSYTEEDAPNPLNWYGTTKLEGENAVQSNTSQWIILRIAYPYRADFEKKDFMRAMLSRLQENQPIKGVTDHIFCPTFIDDLAETIDTLISNDAQGIYHAVGSQALSPYDAAMEIADEFTLDKNLISQTTRAEYFAGKAERPFRLALKNDKISGLGVEMRSFTDGLKEVKQQLENSNN